MATIVSWCCISGDDHIHLLPRMVKSLVDRPGGSAADEIVLGWNGKNDDALRTALFEIGVAPIGLPGPDVGDSKTYLLPPHGIPLVLFRQQWTGKFNVARQESFERASGIWRGYIDLDDELALPADPLVQTAVRVKAPDGVANDTLPRSMTLQDWLQTRRPAANVIYAPHYYRLSSTGQPITIMRRPRIVKWDPYWAWIGRVHEETKHVLGREVGSWNSGILLLHRPPLAEDVRRARNIAIHEQAVAEGDQLNPGMQNGGAAELLDRGDYTAAVQAYTKLAATAGNPEEKLLYLGMSGTAMLLAGTHAEAGRVALEMIGTAPERPEGYLMAAEAAARLKDWWYAVRWYEAGGENDVPVMAMVDDRLVRFIQPVYSVGTAYLKIGMYEKALRVAERALTVENDPYALRVKQQAEREIKWAGVERKLAAATAALDEIGLPALALRTLESWRPVLNESNEDTMVDLRRRLAKPPALVPTGSFLAACLAGSPEDAVIPYPVDAVSDEVLSQVVEEIPDGKTVRLCAQTVHGEGLPAERVETVTAVDLLARCERIGEVQDLMLVEDVKVRAVVAQVQRSRAVAPWKPDVTFFCPVFGEQWGPWRLHTDGTGGSEESVIYLAEEFSRRGLNVQVYAPLDRKHAGVHVEGKVRWRPLESCRMTRPIPGLSITHRAPSAVRLPCFTPDRLYVWHQDAMYQGGEWTEPVVRAIGHIFVSKWQRAVMLGRLDHESVRHVVAPNGIPETALAWAPGVARDPLACAYISSPLRGLAQLLDVWPEIREAHPEARLHCFYGWHTIPQIAAQKHYTDIMQRVATTEGVEWHDRLPQDDLQRVLQTFGAWLYPCSFAEAYAIAGVRATAAGLLPVYTQMAALPEVQYPSPWAVPADKAWDKGGREEFLFTAIRALGASAAGDVNRDELRAWAAQRTWKHSADLILGEFKERGLL